MQSLRLIFTCLVVYALFAGPAQAQDSMEMTFPADALARLKMTDTPTVAQAAGKISTDWDYIANSYKAVGKLSVGFDRAMQHNIGLLEQAAAKPDDPLAAMLVNAVEQDLAIKSDYLRIVETTAMLTYSDVQVEVRTKRSDGKEVHGYFVGFSPRHLAGSDPMFRFNNPTSPSTGTLPPGRYEMTANLNGRIVQRQEVSVGIQGQTGQPITCLVP